MCTMPRTAAVSGSAEGRLAAGAEVSAALGLPVHPAGDVQARERSRVPQRQAGAARAAREHRRRVQGLDGEALEVAVALLHDHQAEGDQHEREEQRQAVGVVEPGEQHQAQQHAQGNAGARGQDVEPAPLQHHRQQVHALAAPHPHGQAPGCGAAQGREGVPAPPRAG